jgi:hypothetical protein
MYCRFESNFIINMNVLDWFVSIPYSFAIVAIKLTRILRIAGIRSRAT